MTKPKPRSPPAPQSPDVPDASAWLTQLPWLDTAKVFSDWHHHGMRQMTALWSTGNPGEAATDRRFAAPAWQDDMRFDVLSRVYLGQAQAWRAALDAAPIDERLKGQWSFVLRQVLDAASPANCLATNPDAMKPAISQYMVRPRDFRRAFEVVETASTQ